MLKFNSGLNIVKGIKMSVSDIMDPKTMVTVQNNFLGEKLFNFNLNLFSGNI